MVHESGMSAPSRTIPPPSERYTGWESWRHGMESWTRRLTLLGKARSYEPGDPDVRIAEARVLSWKGDYKGSVQHYDSVLADHPGQS